MSIHPKRRLHILDLHQFRLLELIIHLEVSLEGTSQLIIRQQMAILHLKLVVIHRLSLEDIRLVHTLLKKVIRPLRPATRPPSPDILQLGLPIRPLKLGLLLTLWAVVRISRQLLLLIPVILLLQVVTPQLRTQQMATRMPRLQALPAIPIRNRNKQLFNLSSIPILYL